MRKGNRFILRGGFLIAFAVISGYSLSHAQGPQPGRSIGSVAVQDNLIVLTLDEDAVAKENLFNLAGRTLRFRRDGSGYRVEHLPFQWDDDFGSELTEPDVTLRNFRFPFSGREWDRLSVATNGNISFIAPESAGRGGGQGTRAGGAGPAGRGGRGGRGLTVGRFDQLGEAAGRLINTIPAISVFFKPRMSGDRYVKELQDSLLVSWSLTETYAGIQDFHWTPTVNKFQAVLHKDGSIDMSYQELSAEDGIVGLYPMVTGNVEKPLSTLMDPEDPAAPPNLDIRNVRLAAVDGLYLKVTLETRGPIPPAGDPGVEGVTYRIYLDGNKPPAANAARPRADVVWSIRGAGARGRGGRGGGGGTRYVVSGEGVSPTVMTDGNTISVQGILPAVFQGLSQITVYADDMARDSTTTADQVQPAVASLSGLRCPEVHLSALKESDGPFPVLYESFHYMGVPRGMDLTYSVTKGLGDNYDFLVYYSDFRIDNQEAGTPSTGPMGGNVTGIGVEQRRPEDYGSAGRFQFQFAQPVYIGSCQGQEQSPPGVAIPRFGGLTRMTDYNFAMSQVGHELAHRWSAFVDALVNGERIPLAPTHWARGLHAPAAFPYRRISEASAMGGGVWQDNHDGTYTQLDDDYYTPATGFSPLDLYLMGLAAPEEVPDFFILRNLVRTGEDANGHPIYKADRVDVTIKDVIAAEGPRMPPSDKSQKAFNTGMVVVVKHGAKPSRELIERTKAIGLKWIEYWATTTGHRATMTINPR